MFGSTSGGNYPYWGMNIEHTTSGWRSFHSSLRGSLILNWGNDIRFSSAPANTTNASLTHHMMINTVNGNVGIGTTAPNAKLDLRNGHLYVGDDTFNNPGSWGATINLDDNVHSRVLIEERGTGVQTALMS
ncbi:hypothetical protein, partial [Roseivirga sp. E12]|uniref:hypothetical protein n=1 Tax=Roseivirga sp. E12 TaxID=2819237 RepID=UPI001ABD3551